MKKLYGFLTIFLIIISGLLRAQEAHAVLTDNDIEHFIKTFKPMTAELEENGHRRSGTCVAPFHACAVQQRGVSEADCGESAGSCRTIAGAATAGAGPGPGQRDARLGATPVGLAPRNRSLTGSS